MATIDASLLVSLFRSSSAQRPRPTAPLARPEAAKPTLPEPRVGVVVDGDGLCDVLPIQAIADRLAAEPGIAHVSAVERVTTGYVGQFLREKDLDRLVVGSQYADWIRVVSNRMLGGVKRETSAVRVVDLSRLCARVHGGEEATAKALLLLLAAVARVRSADAPPRVSVDEELQALLARHDVNLSPRVAVLACPAAFASLRMIGQIGRQYLPGAVPVEVPCYLNMDRQLTARAFELGADAVLSMGCSSRCELGCQLPKGRAEAADSEDRWCSDGQDRPLASVTVSRLRDLVEALDSCLSRV